MQLFVSLVAALILDRALAIKVPECALKNNDTLCRHLKSAHLQSTVLEIMLRRNESLKDITERVSRANEAISKALNTTNRTRLLRTLRRALNLENEVLSQFIPPCETYDPCSKEQLNLMQTMFVLVEAIMEATLGNQKKAVTQAFDAFRSDSGNLTDRARKMATEVLAAIPKQKKAQS